MKVGLSQLITPREWSFTELVRNARAAGYEVIEVTPVAGSQITLDTAERDLEALARLATNEGIAIVSLCGSAGKPADLLTSDEAARREGIETTKAMLRTAKTLGADTILHTMGRITPELYYHVAYANGLRSLQALAPFAEQSGVSIAVEYVWNGFLPSPLEMAGYLGQVASPHVGFYFDPANMRIYHHSEHWARLCGPYIKKMHAKDFSFDWKTIKWPPLLQGSVNWSAVMKELRRVGYDDALISEVSLAEASLEETAAAIRKLIAMSDQP